MTYFAIIENAFEIHPFFGQSMSRNEVSMDKKALHIQKVILSPNVGCVAGNASLGFVVFQSR